MKNPILNLALGLVLLGAVGTASAQSTIALSNLSTDTPPAELTVFNPQWVGKEFTTGNGQTWNLDSIQLMANEQNPSSPFQLSLYSDAGGEPGTSLVTFSGSSPSDGSLFTELLFSAPANTTLSPSTTYWLVASVPVGTSGNYALGSQSAGSTSYTGMSGWSFATGCAVCNAGGPWTIYASDRNPMYEIDLTPAPEPTTLALAGLSGLVLLLFRRKK